MVVEVVDMINKNKNIFWIVFGRGGGGLKPNIMIRKGAIVTYIWSFHENFENYRKLFLLWKDCILVEDMSNNIMRFLVPWTI